MESGRKRAREQAVDQQTSDLDLARIRAAEYERLRPERERDRRRSGSWTWRRYTQATDQETQVTRSGRTGAIHRGLWLRG